jgi:hypothetical protein
MAGLDVNAFRMVPPGVVEELAQEQAGRPAAAGKAIIHLIIGHGVRRKCPALDSGSRLFRASVTKQRPRSPKIASTLEHCD